MSHERERDFSERLKYKQVAAPINNAMEREMELLKAESFLMAISCEEDSLGRVKGTKLCATESSHAQ